MCKRVGWHSVRRLHCSCRVRRARCPLRGDQTSSPVVTSQIRIEPSLLPFRSPPPLTTWPPQGEKHTDLTKCMCPINVLRHSPVFGSQILTVLSLLPLARRLPSGAQATEFTQSQWSVSWHSSSPVDEFQILTVLSQLPLARRVPSWLHDTDVTALRCPLRGDPICSPVVPSQIRIA